jgi:SAM-dependent methyltransferase
MLVPTPETLPAAGPGDLKVGRQAVSRAERLLQSYGLRFAGADILEVGCHGGSHACAMAERGARTVLGIDIPQYGVIQQLGGGLSDEALSKQSRRFDALRQSMVRLYEEASGDGRLRERVSFRDLDVVELTEQEKFDLVVSWETLEHLPDPGRAFASMFRALRPGGACFHEYNPFFAVDGGHSLCCLDFPFGHALISNEDFERYVRAFRPVEAEAATRFYRQSLNRMTLADLLRHVSTAGFEVVCLLPFTSGSDLEQVAPEIFTRCRALYPTVATTDLVSRVVWVVLRKPAG